MAFQPPKWRPAPSLRSQLLLNTQAQPSTQVEFHQLTFIAPLNLKAQFWLPQLFHHQKLFRPTLIPSPRLLIAFQRLSHIQPLKPVSPLPIPSPLLTPVAYLQLTQLHNSRFQLQVHTPSPQPVLVSQPLTLLLKASLRFQLPPLQPSPPPKTASQLFILLLTPH